MEKNGKIEKNSADAKHLQTKKIEEKRTERCRMTMMKEEREVLNKKILDWNNKWPIGTKVVVAGYEDKLETRTKAMILFEHRAAIYMQGYKGYFNLDDVTAIEKSE